MEASTKIVSESNNDAKTFMTAVLKRFAHLESEQIKKFCVLDPACVELMRNAVTRLHLSARSYYRIIKVARTIADLMESENIKPEHIAEAIQYRFKTE